MLSMLLNYVFRVPARQSRSLPEYPNKAVVQPNVQDLGAKTYFSAIIQ
jgi:hypothetical protein